MSASASIIVKDSTGVTVATQTKALAAGEQTITWDGRTTSGTTATAGTYSIEVTARDASGQPVNVSTDVKGAVSSVDLSGDAPVLLIGTTRIPMSSVKSIGT